MGSTVISIPDGEGVPALEEKKKSYFSLQPIISYLREKKKKVLKFSLPPIFSNLREKKTKLDLRRVIHSVKVGTALVLVSLLYLLDPLFSQVGANAMWAIMTVVVIFEFYAGATLSKGLNRGLGTILGGGLGCLAAALAQEVGGIGNAIVVGVSVFIFAAAATYTRMVPSIKKRYDYGVMIFILTFNLVVVSGIRAEEVMTVARERLSTIGMGFAICIFVSLLVFPVWASDELHHSFASKFEDLALSIEGCLEEYFSFMSEKENQPKANFSGCKSILNSKFKDEALTNFAKWEPWHGKFGLYYPWEKYLQIGEHLRELAVTILSLKTCLQSPKQPTTHQRETLKEPCEAVGSLLAWTLRELGESILKMRRCHAGASIVPNLKSARLELGSVMSSSPSKFMENGDHGLAMATLVFLLMEVVEKVEKVAKEVEQLGEIAHFRTQLTLICPSTL
ncbi:aluminum-activated malate transporter 13-like [Juglans microcarpa x Juglans regia]|uniref:aluminum-activated malate transporter 13-like n=1 Tax=Juglans microcarpa x Juglans regia TaxID=2249226 RepID=UPI001B7F041E|nr:aluminum-activated malate transporter 13-like [Juglans microcarpa x Juglans regia]